MPIARHGTPLAMILGTLLCAGALAAEDALDVDALPANEWVRVETPTVRGYDYARPVFVPTRGQLLHWGVVRRVYRIPHEPRNDVRAFDVARGRWVSDRPSAPDVPGHPDRHNHGEGAFYLGSASMLESGTPTPSAVLDAVCWDAKRKRLVYTMKGLMAAYDPATREWQDLEAKTLLDGRAYPGGPPVYGAATCYDPVNDEILLFSHYAGHEDPKNVDRLDVDGRVSSHHGTFRYRFDDNTWRRVGETFGSDRVRTTRQAVFDVMRSVSDSLDRLHVVRRRPNAEETQRVTRRLEALATEAADALQLRSKTMPALVVAAQAAGNGELKQAIASGAAALREFEWRLDGPLRVEPPPRCAAPMVYDPEQRVIVMFGGHSGRVRADLRESGHLGSRPAALNDTWLYDVTTRQWRNVTKARRPPKTQVPHLFRDPETGLIFLVAFEPSAENGQPDRATLWSLDLETVEWSYRGERDFPGELAYRKAYASRVPLFTVGFDEDDGLLVLVQNVKREGEVVQQTFVLLVDLSRLPSEPAPRRDPEPKVVPQRIPEDDPEWVETLENLPANQWVDVEPNSRAATRRDWGNAAVDPVRGHVYYFGGGHSTYQVNDVAIYAVGANQWVHAAGDHDDFVPPVSWGGLTMGYRGGPHAHHQRNQYVALDGRMYYGGLWDDTTLHDHRAWFYDLDRGGVWRWQRVAETQVPEDARAAFDRPMAVDADGRVLCLHPRPPHRYARKVEQWFASEYDTRANRLVTRKPKPPWPLRVGESRAFCWLPDRERFFLYEYVEASQNRPEAHRNWWYDWKKNRFVELKPQRMPPPDLPAVVEYLPDHDALLAVFRRKDATAQWVYLLDENTWVPLPLAGDSIRVQSPYGQLVYVERYGVLVNLGRKTSVMRPDVSMLRE